MTDDNTLSKNSVQAQVPLPEGNGNCANLLNRRYSHSLPSLPPSQEFSKFICKYASHLVSIKRNNKRNNFGTLVLKILEKLKNGVLVTKEHLYDFS